MEEQKPVAWVKNLTDPQPKAVTDLRYCSVAEVERGEYLKYIPLYTHPSPANDFHPDWDAMAVMVEEQQRMALRIEELENVLSQLLIILGPTPPECCGCAYEWQAAIDLIKKELE